MLIVRRRAGESILIGDSIEIEIAEIGPNKVKIGVRAPIEITVQRKEMAKARERNLLAASLPVEKQKELAQNLTHLFPQSIRGTSDKNFEARYFRHPKTKENLEPA